MRREARTIAVAILRVAVVLIVVLIPAFAAQPAQSGPPLKYNNPQGLTRLNKVFRILLLFPGDQMIVLSDNSHWYVQPSQAKILKGWSHHQRVRVTRTVGYQYPYLLTNLARKKQNKVSAAFIGPIT